MNCEVTTKSYQTIATQKRGNCEENANEKPNDCVVMAIQLRQNI